jgi:hypothetical protein
MAIILLFLALTLVTSPIAPRHPVYVVDVSAGWDVSVSLEQRSISLLSEDGLREILVDGDGTEDDGMFGGIYLRVWNRTFSGDYLGHEAPLIAPERSFVPQSYIALEAERDVVNISMVDDSPSLDVEPSLYPLLPPFRMQIQITFGDEIVIQLRGLYYILPVGLERVLVWNETGEVVSYDTTEEGPWRAYFEEARVVEFVDNMGFSYRIETDARVIQFEALPPGPGASRQAYEIDFDHSYKDYGQFEVITTLYIRP